MDLGCVTLIRNILYMVSQDDIIKSVSYDQEEIIRNIMQLYCPNKSIDVDPTFSKGVFYQNLPKPKYVYDLHPQSAEVIQSDCRHLPHEDESVTSIMFDPPFQGGGAPNGIMKVRFGYYKSIPDLWNMYRESLKEFHRILKPKGVLIFKCQDAIESGKQYLSHIEIINYALSLGFYPKDIFILVAKNRLIRFKTQQHARKYHSYFLVFIKQKNPVQYSGVPTN